MRGDYEPSSIHGDDRRGGSGSANMIRQTIPEAEAQHHEKMVLGSMLLDNAQVPKVVKTMTGAWFRVVKHRFIFEAIQSLHRRYAQVNLISVGNILADRKQLNICGGVAYLTQLTAYVTKAAKAHHDKAIRQGVKEAGGKVE